jgi:hypothetical protein
MPPRDPDEAIVAVFKTMPIKNESKSATENRPVFDDMDVVEMRYPGSKNVTVQPALAVSHWVIDPETGEQVKLTYAERFKHQFQQFKAHEAQTKSGTPLTEVGFLTEARRAELRACNIYTVEALASIEGMELKNLGLMGREFKSKAVEYLEQARSGTHSHAIQAELDALRAQNALLIEDVATLKNRVGAPPPPPHADVNFEGMTIEQLRKYCEEMTGFPVQGAVNRKTLIRMAREATPENKAA